MSSATSSRCQIPFRHTRTPTSYTSCCFFTVIAKVTTKVIAAAQIVQESWIISNPEENGKNNPRPETIDAKLSIVRIIIVGTDTQGTISGKFPFNLWLKNQARITKFANPLRSSGTDHCKVGSTSKPEIENGSAAQMIVTRQIATAPIVRISSCLSHGPGWPTRRVAITAVNPATLTARSAITGKNDAGCIF